MWLVEMEHGQSVSMKVSHRRLRSATTTLQCSWLTRWAMCRLQCGYSVLPAKCQFVVCT